MFDQVLVQIQAAFDIIIGRRGKSGLDGGHVKGPADGSGQIRGVQRIHDILFLLTLTGGFGFLMFMDTCLKIICQAVLLKAPTLRNFKSIFLNL